MGRRKPLRGFFTTVGFKLVNIMKTVTLSDPEINRQCTVVIWRCTNDPEVLLQRGSRFDHLLRPQDLQGRVPPARETLSSLDRPCPRAAGRGASVKEWHSAGHSPSINLLPWRGQRLQQLRSRLFVHIGTVASLLSLVALLGLAS